jgi:hypothetical protein
MPAKAPLGIAPAQPGLAGVAVEGRGYLRDLSTIEHIAGFEHTARRYAASAEDCIECDGGAAAIDSVDRAEAAMAAALVTLKSVAGPRRRCFAEAAEQPAEAIPFTRSALIDILSDSQGNYVERRPLKLADLPAKGDALGYLYRYWLDLRRAGALQFSNIDTVHLARAGVIGKMHVVDVGSPDPNDFRFELVGYALPLGQFEKPRALPVSIYAESTMLDYNTVRLTGVPQLRRLRCRLGGSVHHYTRLILPFLDERDRVARLCVAIRQERGDAIKVETNH